MSAGRSFQWPKLGDETTLVALIRTLNVRLTQLKQYLTLLDRLTGTVVVPNGTTTPDVSGAHLLFVSNTAPTSITNFLNAGIDGREIIVWSLGTNTTLVHSAQLVMKGGVNVTMANNEIRRFIGRSATGPWREVAA